jgi:hypothetical protein
MVCAVVIGTAAVGYFMCARITSPSLPISPTSSENCSMSRRLDTDLRMADRGGWREFDATDQPWAKDPVYSGTAGYTQSNAQSGSYPLSIYPPTSFSGCGGLTSSAAGYPRHRQAPESNAHVDEMFPLANVKGRAPAVGYWDSGRDE